LGVTHRVSQALCYYILPASAKPIVRSTVQVVSEDELKQLSILDQNRELDSSIRDRIATDDDFFPDPPQEILDEDYEENIPAEPDADIPEADAFTPELFDSLLSAEVLLPREMS
jgi:hypothetical protein